MRAATLFLKLVIVGALAILILIALYMVDNVISGRQSYRDEAVASIAQSYATEQKLLGPVLVQPYRQTTQSKSTDDKGVQHTTTDTNSGALMVYPRQLNVTGTVTPSIRRHGLYRVPVYELAGDVAAHFDVPPSRLPGTVQWGVPFLAWTVKDARGIVGMPTALVNGATYAVSGATVTQMETAAQVPVSMNGANLRVLLPAFADHAGGLDVRLNLRLAGTQKLSLVPLADANRFELSSPWSEPLFAGQFLPNTREIGKSGFHAVWEISSLASATQQQLTAHSDDVDAVSVSLADLIDPYKLADRAVKYGILFVLLTFGGFFLFELGKRMLIHPVQYLLVGFCQAVFFLLLISFSEHIGFGPAYLLASAACIGLLTYYLVFVLKSVRYVLFRRDPHHAVCGHLRSAGVGRQRAAAWVAIAVWCACDRDGRNPQDRLVSARSGAAEARATAGRSTPHEWWYAAIVLA